MRKLEGRAAELELGRIENDPATAELARLCSEAETLHEERKKQAKLVAGIAYHCNLYRALVAKNDAPLVEGESGQALMVAEAASAGRRELAERTSELRTDLSLGLQADAHSDELAASNEAMGGS